MKQGVLFLSLACAAVLAACQTTPVILSGATAGREVEAQSPFAANTGATQAWGYVYTDPEGKPLANVRVEIAAWAPIHGKLQASHKVAMTNAAGRFAFTAPSGKYLLTIGNDEAYTPPPGYQTPSPLTSVGDDPGLPNMHWLATVHDTIVLTGGSQQIKASLLPKQIVGRNDNGTYKYMSLPRIENTDYYRVTELSRIEAECLAAEQIRRRQLLRQPLVPDEWLMENARAIHKAQNELDLVWDGFDWAAIGEPRKAPQSSAEGGPTCAVIVLGQTVNLQERKTETRWFGVSEGSSTLSPGSGNADDFQIEEWFVDPRLSPQIWPSPVTGT